MRIVSGARAQLRSPEGRWRAAAGLAMAAALLLGGLVASEWLRIVWPRLTFPHELEWMEGGMLGHVARVLDGLPIYAEPTPEFMAFVYPPLYDYVSALVAQITGLGLLPLRLVSLVSAIACAALVGLLVRVETRGLVFPTWAGLLFVGTFELSGGWFDLARVDSLALALALGALLAGRSARTLRGIALAGVLTALAFLTKQTTLVVAVVLLAQAAITARWRGPLTYALALGAVAGAAVIYHQIQSQGWYWYYTVALPATHGMKQRGHLIQDFWRIELAQHLPIAFTCALLFWSGAPILARSRRAWFAGGAAALLVLGSYASRLHMGSYLNDLMPAHAALAWLFGLTLHGMCPTAPHRTVARHRARLAAALLAAAQIALLWNDWSRFRPDRGGRQAGDRVVASIAHAPGEILVVNHPHFAILAGTKTYAHQMAMVDVFEAESDSRGVRQLLLRKWRTLFEQHHFSQVILDNDWYVFLPDLAKHYQRAGELPIPAHALEPRTGSLFAPRQIWVPR